MKKRIWGIFAALLLCLTLLPTVALADGDETVTEVSSRDALLHALQDGKTSIKLKNQIALYSGDNIASEDVTIDLNNNKIVNNGTISGGTFTNGEVSNGIMYDVDSTGYIFGTISGGTFHCKVINAGKITDGTFYGEVENQSIANNFGTITGGTFYGNVTNAKNITGGEFYGGLINNNGTITLGGKTINTVSGDLDLSSPSTTSGDGWSWDADTNTLTLKNVVVNGKIILPSYSDSKVTISADGYCSVGQIYDGNQEIDYNISIEITQDSHLVCKSINADLKRDYSLTIGGNSRTTSKLTIPGESNQPAISYNNGALTLEKLAANISGPISNNTVYENLKIVDADVTVNQINLHDNNGSSQSMAGLALQNSNLNVTGTGSGHAIFAGYISLDDTSVLKMSGGYISNYGNTVEKDGDGNVTATGLDGLKNFLPEGYEIKATYNEYNVCQNVSIYKKGETEPTKNLTLKRYYTVSYELGYEGATGAPASQRVVRGETVSEPTPEPKRDGYVFDQWLGVGRIEGNDDGTASTPPSYAFANGKSDEIKHDVTFTAQWYKIITVEIPYTIEIKKGGDVTPPAQTFELEIIGYGEGSAVDGYAVLSGNTVTTTGNETYTDNKTSISGTLKLKGTTVQINNTLNCPIHLKEKTADDWSFDATIYFLSGNVQESTPIITSLDSVTVSDNQYAADLTLSTAKIESDGNNNFYVQGEDDLDTLKFENTYTKNTPTPTTYTVSFNANGGSGTMADKTGVSGEYTLPACGFTAPENKEFAGWATTANGVAITDTSITVNANITLYAIWKNKEETPPATTYTVTFDSQGGSTVAAQTGISSGGQATRPTNPTRSGYTFGGWYTEPVCTNAYDFNSSVTSSFTLYAHWTADSTPTPSSSNTTRYTITATAGKGGSISPSGSVRVKKGSDKSFTITPEAGYTVSEVLVDGVSVGAVTTYTFENVRTGHTIQASFVSDGSTLPGNIPSGLNSTDHVAYVQGYADGLVRPNKDITRAETAVMLYRLLTPERRAEIETDDHNFTDMTAADWYSHEVATMANGGYISGYADGRFGGSDPITRAQFVAVLTRFLGLRDVDCDFSDVPENHWAYAHIATAVDAGWISGFADGTFQPDQPISRAQVMTIINRALNRGVDASSALAAGHKTFPDNPETAWHYYEVLEATNGHDYTGHRPNETWTALR